MSAGVATANAEAGAFVYHARVGRHLIGRYDRQPPQARGYGIESRLTHTS